MVLPCTAVQRRPGEDRARTYRVKMHALLTYKLRGEFKETLELQNFPFDVQVRLLARTLQRITCYCNILILGCLRAVLHH